MTLLTVFFPLSEVTGHRINMEPATGPVKHVKKPAIIENLVKKVITAIQSITQSKGTGKNGDYHESCNVFFETKIVSPHESLLRDYLYEQRKNLDSARYVVSTEYPTHLHFQDLGSDGRQLLYQFVSRYHTDVYGAATAEVRISRRVKEFKEKQVLE